MDFPIAQTVKNLPVNQGLILGLRRSSGEGNGNPLQYSCLNSMDRESWRATVHGVVTCPGSGQSPVIPIIAPSP